MTRADNAAALGTSLDSKPSLGQGQAIAATTPLPHGWLSYCSKPSLEHPSRWYATAPYLLVALIEDLGKDATAGMEQTVSAATWPELHEAVSGQIALYTEAVLLRGSPTTE